MNRMVTALLGVCMVMNLTHAADTLPITPGLWEITGTTTNPFLGSRTYTNQECMTEFKFDPKEMMEGMPKDACSVNTNLSGKTMSYDMQCNIDGGTMTGNGSFTVSGDGNSATGKMVMNGSFGGESMEMTVTSEGKRIGDC